jgi:serine/threonine protein kinase
VGEHLSSGAFARVYVANRISDDMEVAVKALRMDVKTSDPAAVERFIREAAIVTHLQHPNLIRILEFGRTRDDVLFMVMERLQGIGLHEIIYREPMGPDRVRNILHQMLDALVMAHGQGLIHRDLNPSNVFLCAVDQSNDDHRDWVKILDFGFAKGTPSTGRGMRATLTLDGVRVGTPGYMAPEILEADPELTPLVDLYAVGILGHEMLTAQPAYRGAGLERIVAQRTADPPEPPQFIAGHPLYEIIRKLIRRDPAERYQSAEVALRDVDALKQSKGKLWM